MIKGFTKSKEKRDIDTMDQVGSSDVYFAARASVNYLLIKVNKCFEAKKNENGNGKSQKLCRSKNNRESKIYHYKEKNKFRFLNFSLLGLLLGPSKP